MYIKNQVRELLTRFGRLDELWLDFSYPGPARERELTAEQIQGTEGAVVMSLPVHKPAVEVPVIEIYLK